MNQVYQLKLFRKFNNLELEDVANKLNILPQEYYDLETGRKKITANIAEKLSKCYKAPSELFLINNSPHYLHADVLYYNCKISSGEYGSSGYINHQNNDRGIDEIMYCQKEHIKSLEDQISFLRTQNEKLLATINKGHK